MNHKATTRMLRVDQAGEYGATRIYAGQLAVMGDRAPLAGDVRHMAEQEAEHRARFDALLAKRGIPFTEKNPESDAAAATALKEKVGALQVPTIVIGTNSLTGFDEEGWHSALNAAGYPRNNPNLRQGATKAGPKAPPPAAPAPVK